MMKAFLSAYQKGDIETTSREQLLLKLLEGGIFFLKQARELAKKGNKAKAREFRSRAMAIITELDNTLDREKGNKEIVEQLDSLYAFMIKEMNRMVIKDEFEGLKNIEEIMEKLLEGFQEAAKQLKIQRYK